MSSPQAFLRENNVFPTTEVNRVHYRFSYAEAPDSFVGPHYFYHDDHWIKTTIPDGTEPSSGGIYSQNQPSTRMFLSATGSVCCWVHAAW